MSGSTTEVVLEVSKLLLSGYFAYASQQGLSDAEAEELYRTCKVQFAKNIPENLEDV